MIDLLSEINSKRALLYEAVSRVRKNGESLAKAEYDYKVKLAQSMLKLKDSGMAATLIRDMVFNDNDVALARLERDIQEANYTANQEYINAVKLELRLLEAQAAREWSVSDNYGQV